MKYRLNAVIEVDADSKEDARLMVFDALRTAVKEGRLKTSRFQIDAAYVPQVGDRVRFRREPSYPVHLKPDAPYKGRTGRVSEATQYGQAVRVKIDGKRNTVWAWASEIEPEQEGG